MSYINPCPAEPGYTLPLQTVQIQISWLLKKPNDLDLHCLPIRMWIYLDNLDQIIWLAENLKAWQLNLFSRTRDIRINTFLSFLNFIITLPFCFWFLSKNGTMDSSKFKDWKRSGLKGLNYGVTFSSVIIISMKLIKYIFAQKSPCFISLVT